MEGDRGAATPTDLRSLMDALGLHGAALARLLWVDKGAPGRWLSGEVPVPPWAVAHLSAVLALRTICGEVFASGERELPERLPVHPSSPSGNKSRELMGIEGTKTATMPGMESKVMHPSDFLESLAAINWRQSDFARQVGCDVKTASRWATGKTPIPAWVGAHLALLQQIQGLQKYVQPHRERKPRSGL